MSQNRTSLEQDIIDYVNSAQEIHEKALAFYVCLLEIMAASNIDAADKKATENIACDFSLIPRTPAEMSMPPANARRTGSKRTAISSTNTKAIKMTKKSGLEMS